MIDPNLKKHLDTNLFKYSLEEDLVRIDGKLFYFHNVEKPVLPDNKELSIVFDSNLLDMLVKDFKSIDYIIYKLGPWYMYTGIDSLANVELEELKYLGKSSNPIYFDTFLGIHGRYERMSGISEYSEWITKAKFLGYTTLGVCERGTLGGVLQFQNTCNKKGIKPILGYTLPIETTLGYRTDIKLYVKNEEGWKNLLLINKYLQTVGGEFITIETISHSFGGLVCILEPGEALTEQFIDFNLDRFEECFLQIGGKEYSSNIVDKSYLQSLQKYINNPNWHLRIPPILIHDAYCLDREHTHLKDLLLRQSDLGFRESTRNHYFKSSQEIILDFINLFSNKRYQDFVSRGVENLSHVRKVCDYTIKNEGMQLPAYEMSREEALKYTDNENLFIRVLMDNFNKKIVKDKKVAWDRVIKELDVIKQGFIDYFLILWDICKWCREEDIQYGPGRGSAAGSIVSYLLGITKINPLDFDLLFERFLNESRILTEAPDIDIDFASDRRDDVIEYMKEKYGSNYVCRVGTYNTLQLKGVIKELERFYGNKTDVSADKLTKIIEGSNSTWKTLIYESVTNRRLLKFVENNMEIIRDSKYVINSIKSMSVHACATIITPKAKEGEELDLFKQIPVRMDGDILVSEWEGGLLADIGYLKEDILSTRQMAKFGHIIRLINENTSKKIDIDNIPLDDEKVYEYFRIGLTQDVFHFGTKGLTGYLKLVEPFRIEDLIATISLYRPGVMASGTHTRYIDLRKGSEEVVYDHPLLEELTKDTYGLYIYQEQIMKIAQVLGGFTLIEADGVRKAMGKMIQSKMEEYRELFLIGAKKNNCEESVAVGIWNKMEVFSSYGFNLSHAAAYSIIGYQCNWFKVHYPLEFWTIALDFAESKNIPLMVSEINNSGMIEVRGPDINLSQREFFSSVEKQLIYWNLTQIDHMGPVAVDYVLQEREKNGQFFSFEEFYNRASSKVTKTAMINCIIAGCFDGLEKIKHPRERFYLIEKYMFEYRDSPLTRKDKKEIADIIGDSPEVLFEEEIAEVRNKYLNPEYIVNQTNDYYWILKQSEICKISLLNYENLISELKISGKVLLEQDFLKSVTARGSKYLLPGIVIDMNMKTTKTSKDYCIGSIEQGSSIISFRMWQEAIDKSDMSKLKPGTLVILKGKLYLNEYFGSNEFLIDSFSTVL